MTELEARTPPHARVTRGGHGVEQRDAGRGPVGLGGHQGGKQRPSEFPVLVGCHVGRRSEPVDTRAVAARYLKPTTPCPIFGASRADASWVSLAKGAFLAGASAS
jgi:hypothetical protein